MIDFFLYKLSALKYRDMKVEEVMTSADQIFMLSVNEKLNYHVR